jgi:L-seryl-tRNA(Ser) seleniumtransferase
MSLYDALGVRRVVNACGIYTDLGGSVLGPAAWAAASEANLTWAAMDELLEASGARIAALCGAEAARVVPGASAGIALAVGAGIARGDGAAMEALPHMDAVVLMQRGHEYKYARCATLAGARVEWTDDIVAALDGEADAILHPAHLDGVAGTVALDALAPLARAAGVRIVVDAAYQCFPLSELVRWATAADVACFSAKYFWGPNAGGFIAGRAHYVDDITALDFTGYESGQWRTFGRAFKLDRATVAATVAALEAWTALDHDARCSGYASVAGVLAARCAELPGARVELKQFTLDERLIDGPINAVLVRGRPASRLVATLAAGDPSIRAMAYDDALVLSTEALTDGESEEIVAALRAAWQD